MLGKYLIHFLLFSVYKSIFSSFLPKTFPKSILISFGAQKKSPGSQKHENLLDSLIEWCRCDTVVMQSKNQECPLTSWGYIEEGVGQRMTWWWVFHDINVVPKNSVVQCKRSPVTFSASLK